MLKLPEVSVRDHYAALPRECESPATRSYVATDGAIRGTMSVARYFRWMPSTVTRLTLDEIRLTVGPLATSVQARAAVSAEVVFAEHAHAGFELAPCEQIPGVARSAVASSDRLGRLCSPDR